MTAGRWAGRWARERPYASHVWPSARQNSPSRPARRDQPVQNSPCRPARRNQPVQNSPGTPQNADFDPLFARRENFIPHAGPLPVQNSPSERPWQAHPEQNSPSEPQNADFGPPFACRENFVPLPPPTRRARRKKSRTNTPLLASCLDRHTSPGQSTVYALYLVTFRREHQSTRGADIPMTVLQHGFVRRKIPITACAKVISGPTYHRRVSHRFESAYADRL